VSRFLDRVEDAQLDHSRPRADWGRPERPFRVLSVTSNKGGVGKTILAANLAVYVRALREHLPILVFGFDDQTLLDRMFELSPAAPGLDLTGALRAGTLQGAIRLGQYGVHHVRSSSDVAQAKRILARPFQLQTVLHRTGWRGLVIIDTKSDFETLTRNALGASDLSLVAVKDHASLEQAARVYSQLAEWGVSEERARVVLSMVNRRVRYAEAGAPDILALLASEVRRRGFPLLESFVSASVKVESLYTNPRGAALPVLCGAPGSLVHQQLHQLAHDVLKLLDASGLPAAPP
jgi:cellulose biosynthesis protein BcsQ